MDERNQAIPEPGAPLPADDPAAPALAPAAAGPADPFAGAVFLPPPRLGPDQRRGLSVWLAILALFGVGGLLGGATELATLVALAGLFIAAQAADLDRRLRWFYWTLTAAVPLGGALCFGATGVLAFNSPLAPSVRALLMAYSAIAAVVSVLLAFRPISDPLTVRLFHEDPPTHALRLSTRLAAGGLMLAIPGALLLRDQLTDYMHGSGQLLTSASLAGQLVGMVVLALAGVGFLVRRDLGGTLERLGLTRPTARQLLLAALGAGVLFLLNSGADRLQHAWLPGLWADDRAMVDMMAKGMGGPQALLLGISAGVGEELTLRGALQPRLGLVLTSALFAALHVQYSWFGMLVILMLGLVLGVIRSRTSTTVAILVHALYDIIAVVTN